MRIPERPAGRFYFCDILFLSLAAVYAALVWTGIAPLSGDGAVLDSDLQTYAQGMAGEALRPEFADDPVLAAATPANSIPNLERILASWLASPGQWATGLLKAGTIAIFLFYAGWYALGRWLYGAPALAAMLALACGITVWVGWGTFWGVNHSDPVPRVFFAAIMPFLLLLGFIGLKRPAIRPIAMLLCGLSIWVHGVSALNCGAMIFTSFLFIRKPGTSWKTHAANLCICLLAFFAPVLYFLWPSLNQGASFSQDELALFHELFELRWAEDYGNFGARIARFLSFANQGWPILLGGIAGYLTLLLLGSGRERLLCKVVPCYLLALAATTAFCWLEGKYAPSFGRLPMGHELVRGLRFCVPLAWLLAAGGIGCLCGKHLRRLLLCLEIALVLAISADRQLMAAQYALSSLTGVKLPLSDRAALEAEKARNMRKLFERIQAIVPPAEAIFCPEDAMPVRYISQKPLAHSFKDGYVHFYNKDVEKSRLWLSLEKMSRTGLNGVLAAWRQSGANWLLCRQDLAGIADYGRVMLDQDGWLLVRKKD